MHVEVSVALNFVISYLYNKLPRRRVDMLGTELEKGLKKKFEGHWYPDKPYKGSGFRCVRVNGEKIDPVIIQAAISVGLDMEEMKEYLPRELTLWIDPNEVSYRIGEKGMVKILYSDRNSEESNEKEDREVQATNRGFNPEAQSFNPDVIPQSYNSDVISQSHNPDVIPQSQNSDVIPQSHNLDVIAQSFNPDAQSFKPIDVLSASLGNLNLSPGSRGLSPSSPISSSSWGGSLSTSPSNASLFPTAQAPQPNKTLPYKGGSNVVPMFTTATFAQTKFGSTKLKSTAKRPTRLSPTEFNNFLRQKAIPTTLQHPGITSPTRSRSLSPRDPRVEFIIDQQQRMFQNQQHLQQQYHQQQLHLQQQHMNFQLRQHQQFQQNHLNIPADHHQRMATSNQHNMGSLHDMFSGPSPLQSPGQSPLSPNHTVVSNKPNQTFPSGQSQQVPMQSPINSPIHSPMTSIQISPENHPGILEGLTINNVPYSNSSQYHQLLLAS